MAKSISAKQSNGYVCLLPAEVAKANLSIEARGFYFLYVAIADYRTGWVPPKFQPEHIEALAKCSKRTRIRVEGELMKMGLLRVERERTNQGGKANVYGLRRVWVKTLTFFQGAKTQRGREQPAERVPEHSEANLPGCGFPPMEKRSVSTTQTTPLGAVLDFSRLTSPEESRPRAKRAKKQSIEQIEKEVQKRQAQRESDLRKCRRSPDGIWPGPRPQSKPVYLRTPLDDIIDQEMAKAGLL